MNDEGNAARGILTGIVLSGTLWAMVLWGFGLGVILLQVAVLLAAVAGSGLLLFEIWRQDHRG